MDTSVYARLPAEIDLPMRSRYRRWRERVLWWFIYLRGRLWQDRGDGGEVFCFNLVPRSPRRRERRGTISFHFGTELVRGDWRCSGMPFFCRYLRYGFRRATDIRWPQLSPCSSLNVLLCSSFGRSFFAISTDRVPRDVVRVRGLRVHRKRTGRAAADASRVESTCHRRARLTWHVTTT